MTPEQLQQLIEQLAARQRQHLVAVMEQATAKFAKIAAQVAQPLAERIADAGFPAWGPADFASWGPP